MKNGLLLLHLFTLLLLIECASVRVQTHFDETIDFSGYKTYCFVSPQRQQVNNQIKNRLFTKEVFNEIKPILEEKGLQEAATKEQADVLVVFYAWIRNQRDFIRPTYRVGRYGRVWRTSPGHVAHYKEGTLVIDIVDHNRQELVWQGIGKGVLDRDNPARNLIKSVHEILEKYPPQ